MQTPATRQVAPAIQQTFCTCFAHSLWHVIQPNRVTANSWTDLSPAQDEQGKSPLMAAAHAGHIEVLRLLLEAGAPWNAIDKQGRCAGEYAMESGQQEAANLLLGAGTQFGWLRFSNTTTL